MRARTIILILYGILTLVALVLIRHCKHPLVTPELSLELPLKLPKTQTSQDSPSYAKPENIFCSDFYKTICQLKKDTNDPTGSVKTDIHGEIIALKTYQDILRENPNLALEEVDELFVNKIYTPKRRQRIVSAYDFVKNALIRFLDSQKETIFSKKEKLFLRRRIQNTLLELPPPAQVYSDEPDLFTKNNIFYERLKNHSTRLRVGGAYLVSVQSRFNMIFSMAHEFAHSIDPCELRMLHVSLPSYDKLTACFLYQNLIEVSKNRKECGKNDQLSETFADWIAVQITALALKKYNTEFDQNQLFQAATNAVRDLCEDDEFLDHNETAPHPSAAIRIEKIFGKHPFIQEIFGCTNKIQDIYCHFEWEHPN